MSDTQRYREFRREDLIAEQQAVFDAIGGHRGGVVPTPFHILLESPDLAALTQALGAFCRYRTGFAPRLSELMVLTTASYWRAEYEFATHAPEARKAGVPGEMLKDYGAIDLKDGGSAIPYHEEDPAIRAEFEATLKREGVESRMNPEFYQGTGADEPADLM